MAGSTVEFTGAVLEAYVHDVRDKRVNYKHLQRFPATPHSSPSGLEQRSDSKRDPDRERLLLLYR